MTSLTDAEFWQSLADGAGHVPGPALCAAAKSKGMSLLAAEQAVCAANLRPLRYARNGQSLTPTQQGMLLSATVLLVGLGGLGGQVLDQLARMGVGHIIGVDGDIFEESNTNRQLLAHEGTLGQSKAAAAAQHVQRVNPAVEFVAVPHFLKGADFLPLAQYAHVVVDALGGLAHRAALHKAAAKAGKPVVCAGIAGYTGWLAVVAPGEPSPIQWLDKGQEPAPSASCISSSIASPTAASPEGTHTGSSTATATTDISPAPRPNAEAKQSVEEVLGNLAPTVTLAASLQCAEILKLLTGQKPHKGMLVFDLQDHTFTCIQF